jgi:TolB-like protein/DNA-binding winged helix-turn-helix (wHTH) protein
MSKSGQLGFFVGDWRVSPPEGLLARGGRTVRLEPKAMEVLVYLASRPGEVVSREALEQNVWRNELVGYGAVTNTVIKLRKALGDDTRRPCFIATIPKMGYQLIAPVTRPDAGDHAETPTQDIDRPLTAPQPERARRSTIRFGAAVAALAALLVVGLIQLWQADETGSAAPASIAVLPFENLSDDPGQAYLADGMTDDIITDLSRLANVRVIASATSSVYRGTQVSPEEVGADLGVTYVLRGSIRRLGDQIRVNAQLTNAKTGFNAWAQRYDADLTDLFAVQDEVTQSIVSALAVRITSQERDRLAQRATDNLKAYDHFQEGQRLYSTESMESFARAREEYRKAIELDPNYGRAYGAMAVTVAAAVLRGWSDSPAADMERALVFARNAVALDASTPQTHFALGFVHLVRREYDQAAESAARATRLAPSYADGYGLLGLVYMYQGRLNEALELSSKGMHLDPYYTLQYLMVRGGAHYMLRDYDAAIAALEGAHERNAHQLIVKLFLTASYVGAGRVEDAEWIVQEIGVLSPAISIRDVERSIPISDGAVRRAFLDDLRKAGVPE